MKKLGIMLLGVLLAFSMTGCNSGGKQETAAPLIIHDGEYAESQIIHQMVKMLVEEYTDATVEIKDQMSPVNNYNDLLKGGSDIMNSYDGTLLTTYLKLDTADVPEDETLYDYANRIASEQKQVRLLNQMGHENTYAIGMPQTLAEQYGLRTISDLVPVAGELVFGAEHEFFSEEGSMKYSPFIAFYSLTFKEAKAIDMALKYSAVESGNIDVAIVYSTDGLNKKNQLVVLEDDRSFFPEYNCALLVREDIFERYAEQAPNLEEVLNKLGGLFTNEIMTDLTYEVDVNGRTPQEVAKEYLVEKGLLPA